MHPTAYFQIKVQTKTMKTPLVLTFTSVPVRDSAIFAIAGAHGWDAIKEQCPGFKLYQSAEEALQSVRDWS